MNNIKIGVLLPTRGDRPEFLNQARKMINAQTMKPSIVYEVGGMPKSEECDITERYKKGCKFLFRNGCDVVLFWEDDDYYAPNYIESMINGWLEVGKPDVFANGETIYYYLFTGEYMKVGLPSAMNMMVTKRVLSINWGEDSNPWVDMTIRTQLKCITRRFDSIISIGIKHGIGKCGGAGHESKWHKYNQLDKNKEWLKEITGNDFEFYNNYKQPQETHEQISN